MAWFGRRRPPRHPARRRAPRTAAAISFRYPGDAPAAGAVPADGTPVELAVEPPTVSAWIARAREFTTSGHWPIVLSDGPLLDEDVPVARPADELDAADLIARSLAADFGVDSEYAEDVLGPHLPDPPTEHAIRAGLATPLTGDEPTAFADALEIAHAEPTHDDEPRLGLAAVRRPADVFELVRWLGACNVDLDGGELTAVARRWEDVYGAYLVALGNDTAYFAVTRPPTDDAGAMSLAIEQWAVCSDGLSQDIGELDAVAQAVLGATTWRLWWD